MIHRHQDNFHWENVPTLAYKEERSHFKNITRQVLFEGGYDLPCQVRYFEITPGGHSTLERHRHVHWVMIYRGEGDVLLGDKVHHFTEKDTFIIPPQTWHQFRATGETPFGFLCIVNTDRDRPERPGEEDLGVMHKDPVIAQFIKY